ncbi:MAG TPA: hypothetical protein VGZ03_06990 [Acidimicrobiales bacterium]|jgi:hypothetical protein|nr:hypothetical protein [Acidimicrobiales bacterium]
MAHRRSRSRRRARALGVLAVALLCVALLVGTVQAAHRSAPYRHSVDESFAAAASALMVSSNATGTGLARVMADPGVLGRVLLESRLQQLAQLATADSRSADALTPPPPDANAASRVIDTLRLRAAATTSIRATLEGLLGLTPTNPVGTPGPEPPSANQLQVPGARAQLRYAGEQLVLSDHLYRGLPALFATVDGTAALPTSQWTSPATGKLMPATLKADAARFASDPRLHATISLKIVAVQTQPLLLPVGPGYPVPPTTTFTAAVSIENRGSAPTEVIAIIRSTPVGRLGHFDSGRAFGAVAANGAVALQLPPMDVVPGGHFLVRINLVHPGRQTSVAGLSWVRTVVVGESG